MIPRWAGARPSYAAGGAPPRAAPDDRPDPCAVGRSAASIMSAVTSADVLTTLGMRSTTASPAALTTEWDSRSATPSARPIRHRAVGRSDRSSSPPAPTSPTHDRTAAAAAPARPCRALRLGRPLRPAARRRCGRSRSRLRARRRAGRRVRRRQLDRRPRGRPPGRARLVRQERQPAAARRRAAGSSSAASSRRADYAPADAAGRRRLRHVPPLPRRLPDRRDRRPRRGRRQPLPGVGAAAARDRSRPSAARRSATGSTAATTARRSARRPSGSVAPSTAIDARRRGRAAWVDVLDLLDADDDDAARPARPLVHRRSRPALVRRNALVVLGNVGDRPTTTGRAVLARYRAAPIRARRARPLGRAHRLDLAAARPPADVRRPDDVKHLLVTNDFPPEDRRDPVAPVGVVAAPAARSLRRAHQPIRRRRPSSTPRSRSASSAPASRCCCRTRGWCGASTTSPAEVGAELVVLDPAVPLGLSARRSSCPTTSCCTAPRSPCPGRLPGTRQALADVLRRARHIVAAGGYPAAEAERAAGTGAAGHRRAARRRHRALPAARRRRARRDARAQFGLPVDAELIVSISRLVPRKGFDVGDPRPSPAWRPRRPDLVLAIAGGGRDERRLRRLAAELGAPVRFLGRVPERRPAAPVRLRRRVHHAVPQPLGRPRAGGLRHRVRRGGGVRACRRSPATRVARPRRWSTA